MISTCLRKELMIHMKIYTVSILRVLGRTGGGLGKGRSKGGTLSSSELYIDVSAAPRSKNGATYILSFTLLAFI